MRLIVEVLPDGRHAHAVAEPDRAGRRSGPQKPRKSRFGRLTHCTGMRNGRSCVGGDVDLDGFQCSISGGPVYQGIFVERVAMLSPARPEIGMAAKLCDADAARRRRDSPRRWRRTSP